MKLVKNMIYNASYQILALLLPLITTPYVARVLSPEGIGINAYTGSIVTYFTLAAALGVGLYGNREIAYVQRDKEKRSRVFWELVFLKFASTAVSSLVFLVLVITSNKWQFYFLIQGLNLISVATDISWYYTGREDFKRIVVRNTIVRLTTVVLTFLLVKTAEDLWIYMALIAGSTVLGNLTVWPYLKTEVIWLPLRELNIWRHFLPTLGLFLPQITMQIYLSLNKSMLGLMDTVVSAGYFDQSDKIVRILFTLVASIGGVFLPRLSALFSENKREEARSLLLKLIDLSNAISMLLIAGLVAVSGTFATYFFGNDYGPVAPLMQVQSLMIILISYGNALGTQYLLASKRTKDYTISAVAGLVTNLILNIILIPKMSAMGAVISTVLTELVVSGYQAYSLRDVFSFRELTNGLWKYSLSAFVTMGVVHYLNNHMSVNLLNYTLQAALGAAIYIAMVLLLKAPVITLVKDFKR